MYTSQSVLKKTRISGVKGEQQMITLAQSDALRAIKRCLCLAEQDLVFCDYLSNSAFWKDYALARHGVYRWLHSLILKHGVNHTYLLATQRYAGLPLFVADCDDKGEREALEVFFLFMGGQSPVNAQIDA